MTIPEMDLAHGVKRCAIYIRVSTAMQRMEGWSLAAQKASLEAFARSKGWKVVGVYADEGKTARKRLKGRKEIFRLLDDVKAGAVDIILFKELDRWFRSVSDFYRVQDVLDEYGVKWVSERQPHLGMDTKEDRLQVNLLLSVGQNETDSTSDRIKYTNKFLVAQKRWPGGARTLPKGYTLDDDQHVIIDPEREPYVRCLLDHFKRTSSAQTALLRANEEYPPGMYYTNALRLLKNPMLYGKYQDVEDFVEKPYMTKAEWDWIQSQITHVARKRQSQFYIFSGMVRCSGCGRMMSGTNTVAHGKVYKYYRCPRNKIQHSCSNSVSFREDLLEEALMEYVTTATEDRIAHVKQITHERKTKKPKKGNKDKIEKQLKKLKMLYVEDEMTWEEYQKRKAEIMDKLIPDEPEEKLPDLANLEKVQALFEGDVAQIYNEFTEEERREFWRGILTEVQGAGGEITGVDFIE